MTRVAGNMSSSILCTSSVLFWEICHIYIVCFDFMTTGCQCSRPDTSLERTWNYVHHDAEHIKGPRKEWPTNLKSSNSGNSMARRLYRKPTRYRSTEHHLSQTPRIPLPVQDADWADRRVYDHILHAGGLHQEGGACHSCRFWGWRKRLINNNSY